MVMTMMMMKSADSYGQINIIHYCLSVYLSVCLS